MKKIIYLLAIISLAILGFTACKKDDTKPSNTKPLIGIAANTSISGNVLVDSSGRAVYNFIFDAKGIASCNLGCAVVWPHVYFENLMQTDLGSGLNLSDFSTITNADGTFQTAYKGHPMYIYKGDSMVNGKWAITGNNIEGGVWFAGQSDFSVFLSNSKKVNGTDSTYLTTNDGMTLYSNTNPNGQFSAYHSITNSLKLPARFSSNDFTINSNGVILYKGSILYTFSGDTKMSDINGSAPGLGTLILLPPEM